MKKESAMDQRVAQFWSTYWCGCGDPESAADSFREIMEMFQEDDRNGYTSVHVNYERFKAYSEKHGEGLTYCILYWLTGMGLIEHGGSVGGSWMTDLGRHIREQALTSTGEFEY